MPNYVLNRDYVLVGPGHRIGFTKGNPVWVPPEMELEAVRIGADNVDGDTPDVLGKVEAKAPELSAEERTLLITEAVKQIAAGNNSKDFTAAGAPTVKAVEMIVDFSVERVEIDEIWTALKAGE